MRSKRPISADVVESGAFCALPPRTQALYMHLVLSADDDGVVSNERPAMMACGANKKDLERLVLSRFVLRAGRVLILKHWWTHNKIDRTKHTWTRWIDDLSGIYIRPDRVYTDHESPDNEPFLDGLAALLATEGR